MAIWGKSAGDTDSPWYIPFPGTLEDLDSGYRSRYDKASEGICRLLLRDAYQYQIKAEATALPAAECYVLHFRRTRSSHTDRLGASGGWNINLADNRSGG